MEKTKAVRVKMKNFNNPKSNSNHLYLLMMRCDSNCVLASLVFLLETVELRELSHFYRCRKNFLSPIFIERNEIYSTNTIALLLLSSDEDYPALLPPNKILNWKSKKFFCDLLSFSVQQKVLRCALFTREIAWTFLQVVFFHFSFTSTSQEKVCLRFFSANFSNHCSPKPKFFSNFFSLKRKWNRFYPFFRKTKISLNTFSKFHCKNFGRFSIESCTEWFYVLGLFVSPFSIIYTIVSSTTNLSRKQFFSLAKINFNTNFYNFLNILIEN